MKRYVRILAVLLIAALLLTGCADAFTTDKYQKYKAFAKRDRTGMTKDAVIGRLGYPDSFRDRDRVSQQTVHIDRDDRDALILGEYASIWVYHCYELPDPANPYRLKITFNGEGKITEMDWDFIPGG